MRRILLLVIYFAAICQLLSSQAVMKGKPIVEIFTDFHYNLDDTSKTTGFGLNRAHIGYNYTPAGNFSALIILNIGSPDDLPEGAVPKRYAFFREASVAYTRDKLTVNFGMVSTRIFDFQQGFWGKRYLGPEFQATYGYGSVADLGIVMDYRLSDIMKIDLSLLNGKGYTNIQPDNSLKAAMGFTITTPNKVAVRLYGDIMRPFGTWQSTLIAFAGFKNKFMSLGAEASYKNNLDLTKGHNAWGISATGSVYLNEKSEVFARYDFAASVIVPDSELQWDYEKDGTYLIGGIQHIFSDNLKIALNYRRTNPYNPGKQSTNAFYINAVFKL